MHKLFTIENLIHEICSYVPESKLPGLARVSSIWFRCAISHLYKTVTIEEALAPFSDNFEYNEDDDSWTVANPFTDEDFKRLSEYTPYVRSLQMYSNFDFVTLETMCKSMAKGISCLFPNVRHILWRVPDYSPECMEVLVNLISPNIDEMSLYIEDARVLRYLRSIVMARLSALRSVVIEDGTNTAGFSGSDFEESSLVNPVQALLTFFTHTLVSVYISLSLSTPSIVLCLSKMPHLHDLKIVGYMKEEPKRDIIREGGFTTLRTLWYDGLPRSLCCMFLAQRGSLTSLTTLSLRFIPVNAAKFILLIVAAFPHIKSLSFGERRSTSAWNLVNWSSIKPIFSCKELTSITLYWIRIPVDFEELMEFLKSRTTWTSLYIITSNPLPWRNMLLYAKHFPNLEHLGIYIKDCDEFLVKDLPVDLPTFSFLTSIDFAQSDSDITTFSAYSLARFLLRICNKPPHQLRGLVDIKSDEVLKNLADLYIDEQYKTGRHMSYEVREFVKTMVNK